MEQHNHPFASQALILSGELTQVIAEKETVYRPGDIFHLRRAELHAERYGATGVRYLVGRKCPAYTLRVRGKRDELAGESCGDGLCLLDE